MTRHATNLTAQYDAIAAINRLAGNFIVPTSKTAIHQISKIIKPEVRETIDGLVDQDEHEIRDGVGDMLFTIGGLYARLGYSFPGDMHIGVQKYDSNQVASALLSILSLCEDAELKIRLNGLDAHSEALYEEMDGMLRIACRIGLMHGYPIAEDLQAVVDSNFTKFDTTVEDAQKTEAKYARLGVKTSYHSATYDGRQLYVTKVAESSKGTDGKDYPAGKWVKSVNFKEPVYSSLVEVASE